MKLYTVLVLLGQVFFRTVAQTTISAFTNVADAGTIYVGSEVTVMCEIKPYNVFMNWKLNSVVVAACTLSTCSNRSALPEHYAFSNDTGSGIFNLTINRVVSSDNGSVLLCENEDDDDNLTLSVQELSFQTIIRSWCILCDDETWCCIVFICLSIGIVFLWCGTCFWAALILSDIKKEVRRKLTVTKKEQQEQIELKEQEQKSLKEELVKIHGVQQQLKEKSDENNQRLEELIEIDRDETFEETDGQNQKLGISNRIDRKTHLQPLKKKYREKQKHRDRKIQEQIQLEEQKQNELKEKLVRKWKEKIQVEATLDRIQQEQNQLEVEVHKNNQKLQESQIGTCHILNDVSSCERILIALGFFPVVGIFSLPALAFKNWLKRKDTE